MRILFPNNQENQFDKLQSVSAIDDKTKRTTEKEVTGNSYFAGCVFDGQKNGLMFQNQKNEKTADITEIKENAQFQNVDAMQDYMTVMSHTLSKEDYAKLEKDGFHFEQLDSEEAVTIVDKIKAELIKAGKNIAGYTDDVDVEVMAEALGNQALAQELVVQMREADLPVHEETTTEIKMAWDMAKQLSEPTDATYRYMLENDENPLLYHFYMAQNSGAKAEHSGQPMYYRENVQGYFTANASGQVAQSEEELLRFRSQADHLLEDLGISGDMKKEEAYWLLNNQIELTTENLDRFEKLKSVVFPITEEAFAKSVAVALSNGERPIYADLSQQETVYEKAVRMLSKYREVEEARLYMSAEVNVKLLKSGFAIDTASMEEAIAELKKAEQEIAAKYFPKDEGAVEKLHIFHETNRIIQDIPFYPAKTLSFLQNEDIKTTTLSEYDRKATVEKEKILAATKEYETLGTAPRADLGDSIKKAFSNVDDILRDLHMETVAANQRAVRILGYNQMDITVEAIENMKMVDETVQQVIRKMTPAAVLQMIRDGVNPLETSFEELNDYFDHLPVEYEEETEKYSKFLYNLEQNKEISNEEKDAFIGVYRMLRQIEKTDGAAIGTLVNTQAEVHFKNLLSAVRTGKVKSVDVRMDQYMGALEEVVSKGTSISDQISRGFLQDTEKIMTQMSENDNSEKEYLSEKHMMYREAGLEMDTDTVKLVQKAELPVNMEHLLATQSLRKDKENPFTLDKEKAASVEQVFSEADNLEEFTEEYKKELEAFGQRIEELTFAEADSVVDVRKMQLVHKQLSVMEALADKEEYFVPMYLGEELTKVHLILEQGSENQGQVSVRVSLSESEDMNEVLEANFRIQGERLTGYFVTNHSEMVMKARKGTDIFSELIKEETSWSMDAELPILEKADGTGAGQKVVGRNQSTVKEKLNAFVDQPVQNEKISNAQLFQVAQLFLRAMKTVA